MTRGHSRASSVSGSISKGTASVTEELTLRSISESVAGSVNVFELTGQEGLTLTSFDGVKIGSLGSAFSKYAGDYTVRMSGNGKVFTNYGILTEDFTKTFEYTAIDSEGNELTGA